MAGANSSSSENVRCAYPVAHRADNVSGSGSKPVADIPSGSRIASWRYCGYGIPLARLTISPRSW